MKILEIRRAVATSRGWYVLESTIAIVGVIALILSASDIIRIFHARIAVRAGVTDGLRCLYPKGEACRGASQTIVESEAPLYRASFQAPGGYALPRSSYSLSASWLTEPVLQASRVNLSLKSVRVTYTHDAYQNFRVMFPVDAHALYMVRTRELPHVEANPNDRLLPGQRVLKAVVTDPQTGVVLGGDAPPHKLVRISHVRGYTQSRKPHLIGEVSFTLEDAWPNRSKDVALLSKLRKQYGFQASIPCYQGSWTQGNDGPQIVWASTGEPARCSYHSQEATLFDGSDVLLPVMVRISGDRYQTAAKARGSVSALLEFQREGKLVSWPIGGRMFDGQTTNADFVIRGVGKGSEAPRGYFDLCKKAGYEECEKYSDLPLVPRNSPIKIKFFVEQDSGSGSVGWAGDSVQLFYPQFALGYQKISCGSSPIPNTCEKSVTPMRPLFTYTDPSGRITSEVVPGSAVRCMKSLPAGVYLSQKDALAQLQSGYTMGAQGLEPTSFWARVSGMAPECAGETKSYTCSDGGTEFLKGCEKPLSYPEDQLLSKCAVRDFVKGRDRIVVESSSEKMMPEGERRLGCTGIQYPACAQPFVSSTGEKYLLSSDNSSCSVAVQHACARWDPPPYFDLDSDPKCPDIQAELIKEYRQQCDQLPQDVDVVVTKKVEEPFVASQAPVDRCQKVSQRPAVEVECAYMAPYPVAQACCRDNTSGCHIETLGGAGSVTTTSSPSQRQSLAVARAQEAIVTVYPRARFRGGAHCLPDEKHCADVQVTSLEHDTRASMSASMQVPVVMLGWLGLGSLSQVSYSEDRVLESSLIR